MKAQLQSSLNKYEWVRELDEFLVEAVLRNCFNFEMVSLEVNEEAKRLNLSFGATNVYTNSKCRVRWTYLHLKRKSGKQVKYKKVGDEPP